MKHLAVLLAAFFVLSGLPALASAASGVRATASSSASSCRAHKKAKKQAAENKGKKKGKDEKKAYGFEL
jgi:hypothetical protein